MEILIRLVKSLVIGTLVASSFLFIFSLIFTSGDVVGIISCIACISTIIFCTYTILDEIRKNN